MRETAAFALGEDRLTIEMYFEDTISTLDQLGLDAESLLQAVRQTGGARAVVSNHAVFDRQSAHYSTPVASIQRCSADSGWRLR